MKFSVSPIIGIYMGLGLITLALCSTVLSITYGRDTTPVVQTLWVLCNTWLFTGLFITAHDAMHGVVAPTHPKLNQRIGQMALFVYAGLSYQRLRAGHILHHQYPATTNDPDYLPYHHKFRMMETIVRWYGSFMLSYLTWHPFLIVATIFTIADRGFGVDVYSMLLFWILPQILSTLQLFYFGTYLPHRGEFTDSLPARSNDYPVWLSLLTCFHFGYHREHHLYPHLPWWLLPYARTQR